MRLPNLLNFRFYFTIRFNTQNHNVSKYQRVSAKKTGTLVCNSIVAKMKHKFPTMSYNELHFQKRSISLRTYAGLMYIGCLMYIV